LLFIVLFSKELVLLTVLVIAHEKKAMELNINILPLACSFI